MFALVILLTCISQSQACSSSKPTEEAVVAKAAYQTLQVRVDVVGNGLHFSWIPSKAEEESTKFTLIAVPLNITKYAPIVKQEYAASLRYGELKGLVYGESYKTYIEEHYESYSKTYSIGTRSIRKLG